MKKGVIEIKNEQGLHTRPAVQIVNIVKKYKEVESWIEYNNEKINTKNAIVIMSLGLQKGEKLTFVVDGKSDDEENLINELVEMIEINKFFEK